jgi:hypothetical protein
MDRVTLRNKNRNPGWKPMCVQAFEFQGKTRICWNRQLLLFSRFGTSRVCFKLPNAINLIFH